MQSILFTCILLIGFNSNFSAIFRTRTFKNLNATGLETRKDDGQGGTLGYRNGTESFFGLKGHPSVVRDV
jgi:hypothetical protein